MVRLRNVWMPLPALQTLPADIDRLFNEWNPLAKTCSNWAPAQFQRLYPAVNVEQGEHTLLLTAELPGLESDDMEVTVNARSVVIKGQHQEYELREGETWYHRERSNEEFERTIELPFEIDVEKAEAVYEKGVLTISLQQPEDHKPKKLEIKAG